MQAPTKDGSTTYKHLQAAARNGNPKAIKQLNARRCPPEVEYLLDLHGELRFGLEVDMMGERRVTWASMRDWLYLSDRRVAPHEVEALLLIDQIVRQPPKSES